MRAHEQHRKMDRKRPNARALLFVACTLALGIFPFPAFAGQHEAHPQPQAPHMQAPRSAPQPRQQPRPQSIPQGEMHAPTGAASQPHYTAPQFNHPGQPGHLPEWLNKHQNLTPQQRENALRQEPGFNRLPQDQQQRLVNRMHALDSANPQQRQRMLQRNEIFERLNPEQKAGVRGASQAFHQMPADRQGEMRRAFHDLRGIPPEQRQSILNSARFQQQFSPQERTVLGNLLSVEPYQPRAAGPP